MDFEKQNNQEPTNKEEKMEKENLDLFENTKDFEQRAEQDPEKAEKWMNEAFANHENYQGNEKWLMDRQRTLLDIYCRQGNKEGAVRMVEQALDPFAQQGRLKKFEKIFQEKFPEERMGEIKFEDDPDSDIAISDSSTFKKVLLQEGERGIKKAERVIERTEKWLRVADQQGKEYKKYNALRDRKEELQQAKTYWGID